MKTKVLSVAILLIYVLVVPVSAQVSYAQAKETLADHFISPDEARNVYPDLPLEIKIPYSLTNLENNRNAWLLPIQINSVYKYFLIQENYGPEVSSPNWINRRDTLYLSTAKKALLLLNKLGKDFPNRVGANIPYTYFFRTKDYAPEKYDMKCRKTITYANNDFLIINWPSDVEIGVINQKCIYYLAKNKRGVEVNLGKEFLPENAPLLPEQQSIYVLTLTYLKP